MGAPRGSNTRDIVDLSDRKKGMQCKEFHNPAQVDGGIEKFKSGSIL